MCYAGEQGSGSPTDGLLSAWEVTEARAGHDTDWSDCRHLKLMSCAYGMPEGAGAYERVGNEINQGKHPTGVKYRKNLQ